MAPGVMWTKEDCDKLNELVERHGKKWTPIASFLGDGKTGKQCRRQWERLNIMTKQCGWTPEEDALLFEYHARYGNKWTRISRMIGGRTDNAVKNRFHALRLKRRTKYMSRAEPSDTMMGKRCLRNCSSLEERRRAVKEEAERLKSEEIPEGMHFKSASLHKPGYLASFEGGWTGGHFPSTDSTWTTQETCKVQSSAGLPYGLELYPPTTAEALNDTQPRTFLLNVTGDVGPAVMAPSRISNSSQRMVDDSDSMESTSENKLMATSTGQSESLTQMFGGSAPLSTSFLLGATATYPLPSRVVHSGQQPIETVNYSTPAVSEGSIPKSAPPDLTLDLTFQQKIDGFDFDSFLHSVSPMSPTAYLKFLNALSPVNRQPSCVSEHDSHMKA